VQRRGGLGLQDDEVPRRGFVQAVRAVPGVDPLDENARRCEPGNEAFEERAAVAGGMAEAQEPQPQAAQRTGGHGSRTTARIRSRPASRVTASICTLVIA
jgi:hypothetical protein